MQLTRSIRGRWERAPRRPARDEGSVVIVAILTVALAVISTVAVGSILNGLNVATTATLGEQAVAQANAGVSDALFRLDAMGSAVTSFCVGQPPANLAPPAGMTSWDPSGVACSPSGRQPLASAPGLLYYGVTAASNQQASIVSVAKVGAQTRTVQTTVYQLVDDFGIYGVSGVTFHGNGQASIYEVDSQGARITGAGANVDVGIGGSATLTCSGGLSSNVIVIPGPGSNVDPSCPTPKGSIDVNPQDPQACTAGQSTLDAFTPCLPTAAGFSLDANGRPYCPLPNVTSGLAATTDPASDAPSTPPQGANSVYDCDTNGGALDVFSTGSSQPIPEGSYYVDSNSVNIGNIDPGAFTASGEAGPVSLFILPSACYPAAGPLAGQSGYASGGCAAGSMANGTASAIDPNCSTAAPPPPEPPTLSLLATPGSNNRGSVVNGTAVNNVFQSPNPEDFNVYWAGCGDVPIGTGGHTVQFGGNFYAPGGSMKANSSMTVVGSIIIGVITSEGMPTITFEYAEHQAKLLQAWTELNYQISP